MPNTASPRFKIDVNPFASVRPFAIFKSVQDIGLFAGRPRWVHLYSFATREEARAFYETIKDLPEYLA